VTLPLSIIIPTKNEEKFLPRLLTSIKSQSVQPKEIIVADNNSDDETRKIAHSFGCKIIQGANHPGKGRNNGVKIAKNPFLLFLDADVELPSGFLETGFQEYRDRNLGAASVLPIADSGKIIDIIGEFFINKYLLYTESFLYSAFGFCIFSSKEIHEKIKGFDENIKIAEDWDYAYRANKISKYRFLRKVKIIVSTRRYDAEGRIILFIKYLRVVYHIIRREKITYDSSIPYSFSHDYIKSNRRKEA
jgi:glycosyltransferase involved in cell wall biosynthesis